MAVVTQSFSEERIAFLNGGAALTSAPKSYAFLANNYKEIKEERDLLVSASKKLAAGKANEETREKYNRLYLDCEALIKQYHAYRKETIKPEGIWAYTSDLHDSLIILHATRILYTFARLTDDLFLRILSDNQWIDFLNQVLAPLFKFNDMLKFDDMLANINYPVWYFNLLSVALLGVRFFIEIGRILYHACIPIDENADVTLGFGDRLYHEAAKYGFNLANDAVWATLNGLSNYPDFFGLSPFVANGLILVCLGFDIALTSYRYYLTYNAYMKKKAELEAGPNDEITQQCLKTLELNYAKASQTFEFFMGAGGTLIIGFSILLAAGTPIVAPLGTFLCMLGTALYLVSDKYADYAEASCLIKQLEDDRLDTSDAKMAQQKAWDDGWSAFASNLTMPLLLMGTLTVSFPAGLLAMTGYALYCNMPTETEAKQADKNNEAASSSIPQPIF